MKTTKQAQERSAVLHQLDNNAKSPQMTNAGLLPTFSVTAMDEYGLDRTLNIAGERPLTIYLDRREIVTLMTLGTSPEALVIGYLRNQNLIESLSEIKVVQVDWETESAAVVTYDGNRGQSALLDKRTVTTGCGQGTMFGDLLAGLEALQPLQTPVHQSDVYTLLQNITAHNEIYKKAGAVHGCALCNRQDIIWFVEDVGRHNAVDAIAGLMWLHNTQGNDLVFYTTGRLTSEMVIKVARIGVPVLLSRSGVTEMGRAMAEQLGVTMIARAKGKHFLVINGKQNINLDAPPPARPQRDKPAAS